MSKRKEQGGRIIRGRRRWRGERRRTGGRRRSGRRGRKEEEEELYWTPLFLKWTSCINRT